MDQGDESIRIIVDVSKRTQMMSKPALRFQSREGIWRVSCKTCLSGIRHEDGVTLIWAFTWNVGRFALMLREVLERVAPVSCETDAMQTGGVARSS